MTIGATFRHGSIGASERAGVADDDAHSAGHRFLLDRVERGVEGTIRCPHVAAIAHVDHRCDRPRLRARHLLSARLAHTDDRKDGMSAMMPLYPSFTDLQQAQRRTRIAATAILLLGTIALSALLVSAAFPILSVAIAGLCFGGVIAGVVWRKPIVGLYVLLFAALFIEQFGIAGLDPIT